MNVTRLAKSITGGPGEEQTPSSRLVGTKIHEHVNRNVYTHCPRIDRDTIYYSNLYFQLKRLAAGYPMQELDLRVSGLLPSNLRGTIDWLERLPSGALVVKDLKTHASPVSATTKYPAKTQKYNIFQVKLYALMLEYTLESLRRAPPALKEGPTPHFKTTRQLALALHRLVVTRFSVASVSHCALLHAHQETVARCLALGESSFPAFERRVPYHRHGFKRTLTRQWTRLEEQKRLAA